VLPLSDKSLDYAQDIERRFREAGFRVRIDTRNAKVQAKIRDAQLELVPYMLVVGPKEAEQGAVALRDRIDGDLGIMPTSVAIDRLREEVTTRKIRQVAKSTFQSVDEGGEQYEY
jgi:threonyl-tRNA synthetase